jgi:hypothetical protein
MSTKKESSLSGTLFGRKKPKGFYFFFPFLAFLAGFFFIGILGFTSFPTDPFSGPGIG